MNRRGFLKALGVATIVPIVAQRVSQPAVEPQKQAEKTKSSRKFAPKVGKLAFGLKCAPKAGKVLLFFDSDDVPRLAVVTNDGKYAEMRVK